VVHGAAAEEETDDQVEISLKKVDDSEFVQFKDTRFLVDHHIDDDDPSGQVEAVQAGERGKAVDDFENKRGHILDGGVIVFVG
jgi:hypothetical protein